MLGNPCWHELKIEAEAAVPRNPDRKTTMKNTVPETTPRLEGVRLLERPDGFYWQEVATEQTYGPFATLAEAVADMEYNAEAPQVGADALREAEDSIGIADWIDPDTGELAEEHTPHIEDH